MITFYLTSHTFFVIFIMQKYKKKLIVERKIVSLHHNNRIIRMKRVIIILSCALFIGNIWAQTAQEEIQNNVCLSGSNYLAYPTPTKALTPAPKGKKAFYISHYGRHGSRYLISKKDYTFPLKTLSEANDNGKLTPLGQDLLAKIEKIAAESNNRYGELTELGALQHHQIANRMYHRFPEVFKGNVWVDAKSTVVIRCIISMESALQEFLSLNPKLRIKHDASEHDMYYMNFNDKVTFANRKNDITRDYFEGWQKSHLNPERLMNSIFNDSEYVSLYVHENDLAMKLFSLAVGVQNSEIRHELDLYDLFTKEELYALWQSHNIGWFMEYGSNELNGGTQPFSQRNLLKKIIHEADSCMQYERPGATLRFGHETMVLPLTCLLDLNGYGKTMHPDDLEANNWINYRIFPMGANIQFIFYRKNKKDKDVLVKVLLNEEEATLPLTAVSGPYYRWTEVKNFYLEKIRKYEESLPVPTQTESKIYD